ncbi:MAG: DUF502 domain-containing protein [candidate division FCPU426 bacterium]
MVPEPHPHKDHPITLRRIFISGLLVMIPLAATILILVFLFNLLDGWLAPMGGQFLRALGFKLPPELKRIPGFGILATLVLTMLTGLVASNYLGRRVLRFGDRIIRNIPLVSNVYGSIRQLVKAFSAGGSTAFRTAVLFEFPRKGIWTVGFLTVPAFAAAEQIIRKKMLTVFLPAAPIPSQGVMLLVPAKDVRILPMSAEQALKLIATLGLVSSPTEDEHLHADAPQPVSAPSLPPAGPKRRQRR